MCYYEINLLVGRNCFYFPLSLRVIFMIFRFWAYFLFPSSENVKLLHRISILFWYQQQHALFYLVLDQKKTSVVVAHHSFEPCATCAHMFWWCMSMHLSDCLFLCVSSHAGMQRSRSRWGIENTTPHHVSSILAHVILSSFLLLPLSSLRSFWCTEWSLLLRQITHLFC